MLWHSTTVWCPIAVRVLQGPEHSSCRIERFLQMSNDDPDYFPVGVLACPPSCPLTRLCLLHGGLPPLVIDVTFSVVVPDWQSAVSQVAVEIGDLITLPSACYWGWGAPNELSGCNVPALRSAFYTAILKKCD